MINALNTSRLLEFAANGYEFFPLIKPTGGKKLGTPKGWPQLGTDDIATINAWLKTAKFGFGMTFGSRRYFAIDLDGQEGIDYFKKAMKDLGIPAPTVVFKTPSGGRHLLYTYPAGVNIKNVSGFDWYSGEINKGTKCDIRAAGGFIGSFGARENGYILSQGDAATPLPELPQDIIDKLPVHSDTASLAASAMAATRELAGLAVDTSRPMYGEIPATIYEGERDNTIFQLVASWVRSGLSKSNIMILAREAVKRCTGPTGDIDIESMVDRTMGSPDFMYAKRSLALQCMLKSLVFLTELNRFMTLHDRQLMTKQACEIRFANVQQEIELKTGKVKQMPVFNLWLRDQARLVYKTISYKPGAGDIFYDSLVGAEVVNTYRDPKIEAIPNAELFDKFKEFAAVICGDEEKGMMLVEFFAYLIQKPGAKIGVAPVIISTKQGVGKNFFLKIIDRLLGESNTIILHSDNIVNNFNSATSDKQLIIVNESVGDDGLSKITKTKNAQAMARLKSMITETNQSIERKGQEIINMKTYANFIFLSNDLSAVQMDMNDRRFKCIINEEPPRSKEFFDSMDILKTSAGVSAVKYGLMTMKLSTISDYMTNYEKTVDDLRVINSGITPLEQEILQDIDDKRSVFKNRFMSKEIFMMYMADRYGSEVSMGQCGKILRTFYEKFRPNKQSKDCVYIKMDMPLYFIGRDSQQRGGPMANHFVYQLKPKSNKAPLLGTDIDRELVYHSLKAAIDGFEEEKKGAKTPKPQGKTVDIFERLDQLGKDNAE